MKIEPGRHGKPTIKFLDTADDAIEIYLHPGGDITLRLDDTLITLDRELASKVAGILDRYSQTGQLVLDPEDDVEPEADQDELVRELDALGSRLDRLKELESRVDEFWPGISKVVRNGVDLDKRLARLEAKHEADVLAISTTHRESLEATAQDLQRIGLRVRESEERLNAVPPLLMNGIDNNASRIADMEPLVEIAGQRLDQHRDRLATLELKVKDLADRQDDQQDALQDIQGRLDSAEPCRARKPHPYRMTPEELLARTPLLDTRVFFTRPDSSERYYGHVKALRLDRQHGVVADITGAMGPVPVADITSVQEPRDHEEE